MQNIVTQVLEMKRVGQTISNFSSLRQDNSLLSFVFLVNCSYLLTELNEIISALLRFRYREGRQKKNISINK